MKDRLDAGRMVLYSLQSILFLVVSYFVFVYFLGGVQKDLVGGDLYYGYPWVYEISSHGMTGWSDTYFSLSRLILDSIPGLFILIGLAYSIIRLNKYFIERGNNKQSYE